MCTYEYVASSLQLVFHNVPFAERDRVDVRHELYSQQKKEKKKWRECATTFSRLAVIERLNKCDFHPCLFRFIIFIYPFVMIPHMVDTNTSESLFQLHLIVSNVLFMFCHFVADQKDGGTQLKLVIDYGDTTEALMKPMRSVPLFRFIDLFLLFEQEAHETLDARLKVRRSTAKMLVVWGLKRKLCHQLASNYTPLTSYFLHRRSTFDGVAFNRVASCSIWPIFYLFALAHWIQRTRID